MEEKFLSIVMPVYNEQDIAEKMINDYYEKVLSKFNKWEFIIVNDRSTDNTFQILQKIKERLPITIINNEVNLGHGPTLMKAYEAAKGELIFHTDSDYQNEPTDFWKLYENIEKNDLVIGVRSSRKDPLHRLILTLIVRMIILFIYRVNIPDANSPFRLMKKGMLDQFLSRTEDSALIPSIFMSLFASKRKFRVMYIPVTHYPRKTGKTVIVKWKLIKFCLNAFKQLIRYKFS